MGKIQKKQQEAEEMTHEEKKVAKIVEELTMFLFAAGAKTIQSCIEREKECFRIVVESDYQQECREQLENLEEYLNEPKNEGMEDIYWELAGSGDPGETSQLLLVGMMVDRAEVETLDSWIRLTLYRNIED